MGNSVKRLLVVEDTDSIAVLMAASLRCEGYLVDTVASADAAYESFVKAIESQIPYDLLLVDINLPDGDGCALLGRVACFRECPPSFVLSADGARNTRQRAIAAGADLFFEKPFDMAALKTAISERLGRKAVKHHPRNALDVSKQEQQMLVSYGAYLKGVAKQLEGEQSCKSMSSLLHQLKGSANLYRLRALSDLAASLGTRLAEQGAGHLDDICEILRHELLVSATTLVNSQNAMN